MQGRRVVVTGMGVLSPVGNSVEMAWKSVRDGISGIGPVTHFDTEGCATQIAGEVRDFDVTDYLTPKDARKMDPFIHYGIAASFDALDASGITADNTNPDRVGVAVAAGIGGIATIAETDRKYVNGGIRKISPFFVPSSIINMISGHVSIMRGFKGPNYAVVTACTTGTHNLGLAARNIAYGDADVMVAGGAEYATIPTAMGGFMAARAMSTRNDEPTKASRPWDQDRDGFVLSDGAAALVLEEFEHARARGADMLAEVVGVGFSGDAFHMTSPPDDGDGALRCMTAALADANLDAGEVDYVNAHATSTEIGDVAESLAMERLFGGAQQAPPVSSTKSSTGHLLGAAGSIEAVFSVMALREGVAPPTINLDNVGEGCNLDYVPHEAREMPIKVALSNSFGFGGTNGTLVLRAV